MDIPPVDLPEEPVIAEEKGYLQSVASNQFFAAGCGLGLLGGGTAALRKLTAVGLSVVRRR